MKKYNIIYATLLTLGAILAGCSSTEINYETGSYILFSDSAAIMPVTADAARTYDLFVGTTKAEKYDRTYVVDIDHTKTNAVEGYHFELESKNITVKANDLVGKITIKGYYDRINSKDSLAVTLKIVSGEGEKSPYYRNYTNIRLVKCYPFNIDDYVGNLRVRATFPFSEALTTFNIKSEKKDSHTLIMKGLFDKKYDMIIKFTEDSKNPMDNTVKVIQQPAFMDASYGQIFAMSVPENPSFYSPLDRGVALCLNMFSPKVGSFGAYWYTLQWISPEKAEEEENGIGTSNGIIM